MNLVTFYESCCLCPRKCGINRSDRGNSQKKGFCGETDQLRVGYIGPHMGEEPPISGLKGSGTVFFSGCSLKCSFCQNHQISNQGIGTPLDLNELTKKLEVLIELQHVHNINFVTPDHFFPHIFQLIPILKKSAPALPMVFNTSGYQSVELLEIAEDYADIYLPDYKYANPTLAADLSKCRDYPRVALDAIAEMVRQKGFLELRREEVPVAHKGVLVRHLILPGHIRNSINALTSLFLEFGKKLPLSLMSQYCPVHGHDEPNLNRTILETEFNDVYVHALDLGFETIFIQFPEKTPGESPGISAFLPDFTQAQPFG